MHHGVLRALSVGSSGLPTIACLAHRNQALPDMVSLYFFKKVYGLPLISYVV